MTTAIITTPKSTWHEMGVYHPESPKRLKAILDYLEKTNTPNMSYIQSNRKAEKTQLPHSKQHIDFIFQNAPEAEGSSFNIDADTTMNFYTLDAALMAAGAAIEAVDNVINNNFDNAFCCVRPPGHHAEYNTAMGFCFFNNLAAGVKYALDKYNLSKIAVVDFDVHHGNGTEDIILNDNRILFCSTYEEYIFPGTAANNIPGHIVNVPLPAYCDSGTYRNLFKTRVLPEINSFKPELIFISAGFDAHRADPLASVNLKEEDFGWITDKLVKLATTYAKGRIVSCLEGGYNLDALVKSVGAHLAVLAGVNKI